MTAQNLFVGPQAATLLTDQGYFHDDGTIQGLGSKVIASDRLKLAISPAGRNCVAWTEQGAVARDPTSQALERLLEDAATSFAVLDALPGALRSVLQEVEEMVAEPGVEPGPCAPYVQLCIALWNERHERPEGYVIGSPGHDLKGLLPYKIAGVAAVTAPAVDRKLWPAGDLAKRQARRLIAEQRRTPDERGTFRVAGAAEMVTVSRKGVRSEIICRWPDRIGGKGGAAALGELSAGDRAA